MKYILANVDKQEDGQFQRRSYFITDQTVSYVNKEINKLKFTRVNVDGFYLQAGSVMNDFSLCNETEYCVFKEKTKQLIAKGCTTVVTFCEIQNEKVFTSQLQQAKHRMINAPIDFVIGVRTDISTLTPTFIRLCKRNKVPIVLVDFKGYEDFDGTPWQRIKEAMMMYELQIIPMWDKMGLSNREMNKYQQIWESYSTYFRIPTSIDFQDNHTPYQKAQLKKCGLFPKKGALLVRSDADYCLYSNEIETEDNPEPEIVVLRGVVLKAGDSFYFKPGFGREVKVVVPGHFIPITEAQFFDDPYLTLDDE
ncbi:hypothetical protein [Bacillus alkalicellulosilyticus]|uniref:hypothetical protein n=1 Tax=Alkalihalobacterium alkalicellulosilyticum TaxID=1912214 RepID=UPI000997D153|nr:hypothetical protein [Bacillus alkalicellulosilyticus]